MPDHKAIDFVNLITRHDFEVMPLSGTDGKKPRVCAFKNRTIHHRETIRLLETDTILTFGIRLKGLTVIDIDEKHLKHVEEVQSKLGRLVLLLKRAAAITFTTVANIGLRTPFDSPSMLNQVGIVTWLTPIVFDQMG